MSDTAAPPRRTQSALDVIASMAEQDRSRLFELVERKAWTMASQVEPFNGTEHKAINRAKREGGERLKREVQDRLYRRHHWDSLRWFLFGGLVEVPGLPTDPSRPWDPTTNPNVKIHQPGFVFTTDEHDEADPIKRMPDKDYLRLLAYTWVHRDLLVVPKSRQLMISWLFVSVGLHNLIARGSQRMGLISKKEEDADALIERAKSIYDNLPHGRLYVPEIRRIRNEMDCTTTGSSMHAMNQTAKGLRSYTWSWLFADELSFQQEADQMITAAMAAIRGGGRMTAVSTPDGEEVMYNLASQNGLIPMPAGP